MGPAQTGRKMGSTIHSTELGSWLVWRIFFLLFIDGMLNETQWVDFSLKGHLYSKCQKYYLNFLVFRKHLLYAKQEWAKLLLGCWQNFKLPPLTSCCFLSATLFLNNSGLNYSSEGGNIKASLVLSGLYCVIKSRNCSFRIHFNPLCETLEFSTT